jgi:thiopeptide-type bacteriocin biosynthesis protein
VAGSPAADFFVLRAPLLALETLTRWADGVTAPAACAGSDADLDRALDHDRVLLRSRLAELARDQQVADGLELTSPDLADALDAWRIDPAARATRSAERSLVRYLTRVAARPDLFGLAGAYVVGEFGAPARLSLAPRSELDARASVDSGLLREIVRRASLEAIDDDDLVVRRNGGIYRVAGRLRVAARRPGETGHRLVAMRPTPLIEAALTATTTADGLSIGSLIAVLTSDGAQPQQARRVVRRLISSDLLTAVEDISVTGADPIDQAIAALDRIPGGGARAAAVRRAAGATQGAQRLAHDAIDNIASALEPTGVPLKRRRLLAVDARRPGEIRLPRNALGEMLRSIDLLARVTAPQAGALEAFKDSFERRFATRTVPLLEALDPDFGIRLGSPGDPPAESRPDPRATARRRALLALIERGNSSPTAAIELGDGELAALARERPALLPGAFAMLTRLSAHDADALAAGDFQLVEPTITGPSGVRLLGRLCRGDPDLDARVREHLRREAALDPDAIFAELSIAPETEAGLNITQRPVLRDWEIEYGGRSGADPACRLELADLVVCVEDGEVLLRSSRLGRRVVPGVTTAMNSMWVSLPAARFLISLAHQRTTGYLGWSWGELADAPALPRITRGRTILALRRWNVTADELVAVDGGSAAAGFRRLARWRAALGLPRLVCFDHPKNRLLVDFDNVLSVDAFLAAARGLDVVRFVEALPADASPVEGPDGHYAHELIVPFTLTEANVSRAGRQPVRAPVSESRRRFQPGTEWLFANLYGPVASADRVLVDHVGPLARRLRDAGLIDRWFFIRYADPARHLRIRFHGRPADLTGEVMLALHHATAPALAEGLLYRISLDTYEREIERYGGQAGVELMEQAAELDSDAAIDVLHTPPNPVERRHLTVASLAGLYADSGLPPQARLDCCVALRKAWTPLGARSLGSLLGAGERAERSAVAETVKELFVPDRNDDARLAALRARSAALAPVLGRFSALEADGILERPLHDVICSLAHMSVNRMLRRGANLDELRVHDALARLYEAQIARDRLLRA